jgi:trimeric autotransporter adhesin
VSLWVVVAVVALVAPLPFSNLAGRVEFDGLAVPGATITATQADRAVTALSAEDGTFRIAGLPDGVWEVRVEMRGFVTVVREVTLPPDQPSLVVSLTMKPYEEILALAGTPAPGVPVVPTASETGEDDAVLLLGTVTNAAATPFAQPRAVGNARPAQPRQYNGSVSTTLANSAWNANPYSFGGASATADTGDVQLGFTLMGPLRLPWILKNGPRMTLSLQRGVSSSAITQSARMPTLAERAGDFSASSVILRDPDTGAPFAGNVVPSARIAPQAVALLAYYSLPNVSAAEGANYQRTIGATTRQHSGRFQTAVRVSRRDQVGWDVSARRTSTTGNNLFDFTNLRRQSAVDAGVTWTRTVSARLQMTSRYQFTRLADTLTPQFAGRVNVSGDAGISGNEQSPSNWGPPTLQFPGIAGLTDSEYQRSSTVTHAVSTTAQRRRGRSDLSAGSSVKLVTFTQSSQFDPRGTVSFTGAATGEAFADFLLGLPAASSIAVNQQGLRLSGATIDAFAMGDFRLRPGITLNAGLRWEFEAPFMEASNRLANLDVADAFSVVTPLTAGSGRRSLLRADPSGFQPRVALSWRPRLSSSLVFRGGYGLYRNVGTYQSLALLLAQQPPFARAFSVQHGVDTPLTLATPFPESSASTAHTVAIDPRYKAGFVHSWQVTVQRELPGVLTMTAGYFGDRGTHLMQAFVPDEASFVYITSGGRSDRHAGTLTVRRRLHNGFTAGLEYTLSKATDNASTFSNRSITPSSLVLAENWRNLVAERGPSSFDQRHRVTAQAQYATRLGVMLDANLMWSTGLPFTPVVFAPVGGTGLVGVRPHLTGISPRPVVAGTYANDAAYAPPAPGTWGDAGRNSIRGPSQFSLDLSASRLFQLPRRLRVEWRLDGRNVLNRVTFSSIDTTVGSPQFGRPTRANAMRRLVTSLQFRF